MTKKTTQLKGYKIDDNIPISGWSRFDTTSSEFVTMTKMKLHQSFSFPQSKKPMIENTRLYIVRNNSEYAFAIRQERNDKNMLVPGMFRVWRCAADENKMGRKKKKS